jgi:hypothetical protein
MAATNGNGHKGGSKTKPNGATSIAKQDAKLRAVELFLAGCAVAEIAKQLKCHIATVYAYLEESRGELLRTKKEYFDVRVSALLEQNLAALQEMGGLLSDSEFLRDTQPERIDAISRAAGILSDKTFILLAAAGRHQERPTLGPVSDTGDSGAERRSAD